MSPTGPDTGVWRIARVTHWPRHWSVENSTCHPLVQELVCGEQNVSPTGPGTGVWRLVRVTHWSRHWSVETRVTHWYRYWSVETSTCRPPTSWVKSLPEQRTHTPPLQRTERFGEEARNPRGPTPAVYLTTGPSGDTQPPILRRRLTSSRVGEPRPTTSVRTTTLTEDVHS